VTKSDTTDRNTTIRDYWNTGRIALLVILSNNGQLNCHLDGSK